MTPNEILEEAEAEVVLLRGRRIADRVQQMHTTLYGVEGQNGLCRKVAEMDSKLEAVESKLTAISGKWLSLMLLAAMVGNAVGDPIFKALSGVLTKLH